MSTIWWKSIFSGDFIIISFSMLPRLRYGYQAWKKNNKQLQSNSLCCFDFREQLLEARKLENNYWSDVIRTCSEHRDVLDTFFVSPILCLNTRIFNQIFRRMIKEAPDNAVMNAASIKRWFKNQHIFEVSKCSFAFLRNYWLLVCEGSKLLLANTLRNRNLPEFLEGKVKN